MHIYLIKQHIVYDCTKQIIQLEFFIAHFFLKTSLYFVNLNKVYKKSKT